MTNFKCERGAIMVSSIFMLLLMVAVLYALIGVGNTLLEREGMQDAADAAAYSSAIFNARGMNLIVFINLLMAALVSVLVALRMAQTFLVMLAGILTAMSYTTAGATAPLAAKCAVEAVQMGQRFNDAKKMIEPILKGLHTTQEAVSVVVPWVAMTDGMREAARYHEPANGAFALPGSTSLPVQTDEFSKLCGHASEFLVDLAFQPMPEAMSGLKHLLGDAVQGVGEKTSKFLCGDGSGEPPTHEQKIDRVLPRHPDEGACSADESDPACQRLSDQMRAAEPDQGTGKCQRDCNYYGPYESRARAARSACDPSSNHALRDFAYQERRVRGRFTFDGTIWTETSRDPEARTTLKKTPRPPCGLRGIVNEDEYQRDSGPKNAPEPIPLCREAIDELESAPAPGTSISVEYREVLRVFSCEYTSVQSHTLANKEDALGGDGAESKSPHRVEDDVDLGGEAFQIRAVAFGKQPGPGDAKEGVVLADHKGSSENRWNRAAPGGNGLPGELVRLASQVGRLSVAQAEFYFDHKKNEVPRDEWMWQMRWTARLKHFRLPNDEEEKEQEDRKRRNSGAVQDRTAQFGGLDPDQSPAQNCREQGGNQCDASVGALSLFDSIVRH